MSGPPPRPVLAARDRHDPGPVHPLLEIVPDEPEPPEPPDDDHGPADDPAEDALFGATPVLAHVRQAARSRLVSPLGLLGCVLARVTAETSPELRIPPIVGTAASLNQYTGLVGPSGAAKTVTFELSGELLDVAQPRAQVQGPGTGEGLISSFLMPHPDRKRGAELVLADFPNAILHVDEIGQLGALQDRSGSTIGATLRSAWSGALLDNRNADPARRRRVPPGSYRLCVVAGIQPAAASVLFDDTGTGTPQRWLWLPATDPHMPDNEPDWPGPLRWDRPPLPRAGLIGLPDHVIAQVRHEHRARQRGQGDGMDAHLTLTRLKLAASLALLHGSTTVGEQGWHLAGLIMGRSTATRDRCRQDIADDVEAAARRRGRLDHARDRARREAATDEAAQDAARLCDMVAKHAVPDGDGTGARKHPAESGCTTRCITNRLPRRDQSQRQAALDYALAAEWVVADHDGRLRPGPSRPAR